MVASLYVGFGGFCLGFVVFFGLGGFGFVLSGFGFGLHGVGLPSVVFWLGVFRIVFVGFWWGWGSLGFSVGLDGFSS